MVHIEPEDLLAVGELSGEFSGFAADFDAFWRRVERRRARAGFAISPAREDAKHENLGGRMTLSDAVHDRFRSCEDLLWRVDFGEMAVVGVISADQQNRDFGGLREVEFAVLQVPQDLLGAIAVMSQVDGVTRGKMSIPDFPERLILAA